jgi:hypothetical protein
MRLLTSLAVDAAAAVALAIPQTTSGHHDHHGTSGHTYILPGWSHFEMNARTATTQSTRIATVFVPDEIYIR